VCALQKENNDKVRNDYIMYDQNVKMHAKAFKQIIIHSKKNNNTQHNKKQLPSLVQGSPVESPSCRTLASGARRRGDPRLISGYLFL